ncbi:MAG TPA: winged helix-turn-helix domain-containing protein [Terracidiphilus sp.]
MATPANSDRTWRFGVFEVDTRRAELRRSGAPVKMRDQSFRILVYLLEHPGDIVTREELRQVLWPSDTFVDFDHSLNTAVMKLRDALGDSTGTPLYIETIPKRGYRFIAPLSQPAESPAQSVSAAPALDPVVSATSNPEIADPRRARPSLLHHPARLPMVLLLLVIIAAISFLLMRRPTAFRASGAHEHELLRTLPITSAAGDAISPILSPDGREIAFVWDGADRGGYDLYVQLIGADLPLRLTYEKRGLVGPPAWSPDGIQIAFDRCDGKHDGVFAVPALGGEERQLTSVACLYTLPSPVAWIANGDEMLMVDRCLPSGRFGVVNLSLATGAKRCLTNPGKDTSEDSGDAFALSPDGDTIAFLRTTVSLCCDIYKVPVTGGTAARVTSGGDRGCNTLSELGCSGLMWTPDGRSLVFVDDQSKLSTLLRISKDGGSADRETTYPSIGSFNRDGSRFVYSQHIRADPAAVWQVELAGPGGSLVGKSKIIYSQFPELDAQPSPDGTRIVWMSMRTGSEEIFASDVAGHDQKQLTHLDRYSGTPRWSPDSKWIAFDSYKPGGHAEIDIVEPDGRNLHSVISAPFDCAVPSWSRDGKAIYYSGNENGVWQVRKHNLDNGNDMQMTRQGGFDAFESYDGKTIYYTRFSEAGIWKLPSTGGAETIVVAGRPQVGFWGHYAVTTTGIYFLNDDDAEPHPTIEFYKFATSKVSPVLALDEKAARLQPQPQRHHRRQDPLLHPIRPPKCDQDDGVCAVGFCPLLIKSMEIPQ